MMLAQPTKLFTDLYLWYDTEPRTGAENMAVDQVLMQSDLKYPVLRVYQWSEPTISFGYKANWTLDGTIEHWGHIHQRTNRYQARFLVELLKTEDGTGGWKITDIQDQEFKPGVVKRRLRTF